MNRPHYIYKLLDPNTLKVMYIGITCKHPMLRLASHISHLYINGQVENSDKVAWLSSLVLNYQFPIVRVIRKVNSRKKASRLEKKFVRKYLDKGHPLTNWNFNPKKKSRAKPIVAINCLTGEELHFNSAIDAEYEFAKRGIIIQRGNISRVAKKSKEGRGYGRVSAKGYYWKFKMN